MKRILIAVLLVTATSTWAGWTEFEKSSSNGGYVVYVDKSTIRKSDNKVKMWVLSDYKTTRVDGRERYRSKKQHEEYDCEDERDRTLYFSLHSGQMGGGDVVYSGNVIYQPWEPIAPDSVGKALWELACRKK